jgi:hypothetical protein
MLGATALLLLTSLGATPSDSIIALHSCGKPRAPIGDLRASAQAALLIQPNGKVVLDSVRLASVQGSSVPGFISALQRQLPACRFDHPTLSKGNLWVLAFLTFRADTLILDSARVTESPSPAEVPGPTPALALEYDRSSPALDERPRAQECATQTRDIVVTKRSVNGQIVEDPTSGSALPPKQPTGVVLLEYLVTAEGRLDDNSYRLLRSTDPKLATLAAERLQTCRFAPGRVAGVPVAVRQSSLERF